MASSKYTVTQKAIEEEWLEIQAAQKDPAKFRVLYNRYYEPIFRYVLKRTANEALTADLTSQVFLKAMKKIKKYQYRGVPFSAWLFRVASNEIAQHFRKLNKNRVVTLDERLAKDLEDEIEDKEALEINLEILKEVINELRPKEVHILELRFFEKRPFKEVADILDITENNAKVRIYRLLKKMKKLFGKRKSDD